MKRLHNNGPKIDKLLKKKPLKETISSGEEDKISKSKKMKSTASYSVRSSSFLSLESTMNDKTMQVYKDENFVCIKDKYPKSRLHLLLIPTIETKLVKVQDLFKLPKPVEFLKLMESTCGKIVASHVPSSIDKTKINFGFHAIQSMSPLHMHIISTDFHSDCLKNKKHWNSFTSPYFIHLNCLITHLEAEKDYFKNDKFNLNNKSKLEEYLKMDLKCHICNSLQPNMPNLKKHLTTHL